MEPDAVELRVLGCLLEKQRTTPDAYPLTLNALRTACNQATNRDPVVKYDEAEIRAALARLSRRGWTRLASGAGSRAPKYRQLVDGALSLGRAELAVLAVLLLRGPQTPGELRQRSERLHHFSSAEELQAALDLLVGRELAERLERRPGQKEARYVQRLGGEDAGGATAPVVAVAPIAAADGEPAPGRRSPDVAHAEPDLAAAPRRPDIAPARAAAADGVAVAERGASSADHGPLRERVARLEREVAELRERLDAVEDGEPPSTA